MKINRPSKKAINEEVSDLLIEAAEEIIEEAAGKEPVKAPVREEKVVETLSLEDRILKWKIEHDEIFETVISGIRFIWKPLSRSEYKEAYSNDVDRDLFIVKTACMYPSQELIEKAVDKKAGISYVLTEIILGESGFNVQSSSKL